MTGSPSFVANLAWDVVRDRLRAGDVAILPIGAGAKQHGLHMPMGTDEVQAAWFAARLAEHIGALVWPTMSYGHYPAFVAYAGSVSISGATFEALVREIAAGLRGFGPRAVLVLDTGLSTIPPVTRALAAFSGDPPVRHLPIYDGRRFKAAAQALHRQDYGSHADEIETSVMLAIAPERVALARAMASPAGAIGSAPGPLSPSDPAAPGHSPSGSWGDPTLASRETGETLVRAILDDLFESAENTPA